MPRYRVPSQAYRPVLCRPARAPSRLLPWEDWRVAAREARADGRLVVGEFGVGGAEWLRRTVPERPGTLWLAVEATLHYVAQIARRLHEGQRAEPDDADVGVPAVAGDAIERVDPAVYDHVFLAFGDARLAILPAFGGSLRAPGEGEGQQAPVFDEIHFLFPDPWTKARHAWRRMLAAANLPFLRAAIVDGGVLHLRTDVAAYAEEALENLPRAGFEIVSYLTHVDPRAAITRWERKAIQEGRLPIHDIRAVKLAADDPRLDLRAIDALREDPARPGGTSPGYPFDARLITNHGDPALRRAGFTEGLPGLISRSTSNATRRRG